MGARGSKYHLQALWREAGGRGELGGKRQTGSSFPFVKLRMRKALTFKDQEAATDFEEQRMAFVHRSRTDKHQDTWVTYDIPGYDSDERLLVVKAGQYVTSFLPKVGSLGEISTKSLTWAFWLLTLAGLSLPFRMWLESKSEVATLLFVKEVEVPRVRVKDQPPIPAIVPAKDTYGSPGPPVTDLAGVVLPTENNPFFAAGKKRGFRKYRRNKEHGPYFCTDEQQKTLKLLEASQQ